jgi:hypothetical protein
MSAMKIMVGEHVYYGVSSSNMATDCADLFRKMDPWYQDYFLCLIGRGPHPMPKSYDAALTSEYGPAIRPLSRN